MKMPRKCSCGKKLPKPLVSPATVICACGKSYLYEKPDKRSKKEKEQEP